MRTSTWFRISACVPLLLASCAADQKAPTQAEVAAGEALPAPPPVPARPASTDSPETAPPAVVEQASADKTTLPTEASTDAALTEGQVAFFADLANASEVEQGKVAQGKAKLPAVKKFADMMVQHHSESRTEQAKLFEKLKLTATDSGAASALKADGERTLSSLRDASAADFDGTYIRSQVEVHRKVLRAIDDKLLPAARSAELEAALRKMRATVEAHLSQAQALQAQLEKK